MNSFVGGEVGASQAPIGLQVILHSRVSFFWPKLLFLVSARNPRSTRTLNASPAVFFLTCSSLPASSTPKPMRPLLKPL